MVRRLSGLINSKWVGAWMLKVPRTMPSRITTRLTGGSSGLGSGMSVLAAATVEVFVAWSGAALVAVFAAVTGGGLVGGGATGGASATVLVVAGGGCGVVVGGLLGTGLLAATIGASSCDKYRAATKAEASAGASISVQSPLVLSSVTGSPFLIMPSTL